MKTRIAFRVLLLCALALAAAACSSNLPTPSITEPAENQTTATPAPAAISSLTPTLRVTTTATPTSMVTPLTSTPHPTPSVTPTPAVAPHPPQLIGYFYGVDHNNHVSDIPADKLNAILYAFADVSASGECISMDAAGDQMNFPQLQQLHQQHPQLTTLISIGGYSHSGGYSDAAATGDSRRRFAQSCVAFMKQNGFDGIDIDWELPVSGGLSGNTHRAADKQNLTALLAELRRQLDELGASDHKHYALALAAPISPTEYANFELAKIAAYLDWFNLEAYAVYSAASPMTNFNAPLYAASTDPEPNKNKRLYANGDSAARGYLAAGVPANKIVLGVPFYGRGWKGVPNVNHGLYQPDTGAASDARVPKGVWKDGAIDYGDLARDYLGSYTRYWEDQAKEPWLYNPSSGLMITYEDAQSLGTKADYVRTQNLGGVMIWHLSADNSQHALVDALYAHLRP